MEAIIWTLGIIVIVSTWAITADHYRTKLKDAKYEYKFMLRDAYGEGVKAGMRGALRDPNHAREFLSNNSNPAVPHQ